MLYFFHGRNDFLALKEIESRKKDFIANKKLANWGIFDLEEEGELENFLEKIFSGGGFFSNQTFLVAQNFSGLKVGDEKRILVALEKRNLQDEIIFLHKSEKSIKGRLADYLKKEAQDKEFPLFNFQQILDWTIKEVRKRSQKEVSFGREAAARLVFLAKEDLWRIDRELDKLINFIGQGTIEKETVEFFLENRQINGAFDLVEALGRKDKKTAMNLVLNMLKNQEDGFLIFGSVINLLRNLVKVYSVIKRGKNLTSSESQKLKMHPFVAQKTLQQLKNFSFQDLKRNYALALRLDEEIKLGQRKIEEALTELVARF